MAAQDLSTAATPIADARHNTAFDADTLRCVLEWMQLSRATEERLIRLYHQGRIQGGVYVGIGQEAIGAATVAVGAPQDLYAPCIRNMAVHIGRGESLRNIFRQWLGRADGPTRGRDGNVHFGNLDNGVYAMISHLGAMISVVAGGTFARRRLGQQTVGFAHIGDGGTSTGDFHEAMNFSAVNDIPLVMMVENNHYAYSTPTSQQYRCAHLVDRALGYGIEGHRVDGNDAVALVRLLKPLVEDIRENPRPVMIECDTMRMRGHGEHDDFRYVDKELLESYKARDPIDALRRYMLSEALMSAEELASMDEDVNGRVSDAYTLALEDPLPSPATLMDGVYADA